ncbi:MAG: hypothetical protein JWM91_2601 [Rhodospirillales bacterium]|nr:hypothetical protein [Rhodospirillales bacterium]
MVPLSSPTLSRRDALVLGSAVIAATLTARQSRAAGQETIRVAFPVPVGTLDPGQFRTGGMELNYAYCVFNRLTTMDAKLQVQPDLATQWEASADLKSWTFNLRPGVKFHNGQNFSADDVVFTYRRLQNPAFASIMLAKLRIIEKVEAIDPITVRFTLTIPYADMPALVAHYQTTIVAESAIETLTTHPIGTGPFIFVEYLPGDQMTLKRNEAYFVHGIPKVDRVDLRVISEYTTAVAALESDEVDVVFDLPPEQVEHIRRSGVASVAEISSNFWQGFIMNCAAKPFDDRRVREAFIKIIDKPLFTDVATFGHATPSVSPIPPASPYYRPDIAIEADIAGSKKLLAEAGVTPGTTIEMFVPGNSPAMERLANVFRDAAKLVDLDITLHVVPQDKFFAEMEGKVPFNVDQFLGGATPDLALYDHYHSSGAWNKGLWNYANQEIDDVLDEARSTTDRARQAALYGRFQEIVAKDGPGAVIYVANFACGTAKTLRGVELGPLQLIDITKASLRS